MPNSNLYLSKVSHAVLKAGNGARAKGATSTAMKLAVAVAMLLAFPSRASAFTLFAIPQNYSGARGDIDIFLTSGTDTSGTITSTDGSFSQAFSIAANSTTTVTIPKSHQIFSAGTVNTNASFTIDSDNPLAAYLLNSNTPTDYTNDITNLLPVESLGNNYRLMNFDPLFESQLTIVASEDGTEVTVTPTADLTSGQTAGNPFNVTLNKGESILYASNSDLTGSSIVSDKSVAVFGGNQCANVPLGYGACDHLIEQMFPTSDLGTEFVLVPTAVPNTGDLVRILADQDNTVVTLTDSGGSQVHNLSAGEFLELGRGSLLDELTSISSNNPLLVGQFMVGVTLSGLGDPAFSLVPDVNGWLDEYIFNVPVGYDGNYLNVAIEQNSLGSLLLDGSLVDPLLFQPIAGTTLVGGNVPVAEGSHVITANADFMLQNHGFASAVSYFGIAGSRASGGGSNPPGRKVPEPTSALSLLALGAVGAGSMLKRKRQEKVADYS